MRPTFYNSREGREHMKQFIRDHHLTHTVEMIFQETGASREYIRNIFIILDLEPLQAVDLKIKFLLENPEMKTGEAAQALKVSDEYVSRLLSMKPSPRLKAALKQAKQTA